MKSQFKSISGALFLNGSYLIEAGMNKRTLDNNISLERKNLKGNFICNKINGVKWILYDSLPRKILIKYGLLLEKNEVEELLQLDRKYLHDKESFLRYRLIRFLLNNICSDPSYWMPYKAYYKDYLFDNDNWNLFAKTHAVFSEILQLKKEYTLIEIHKAYNSIESVVFKTSSYKYFTEKIRSAEIRGIDDCLIHDFKRFGREPYKLTPLIKKRIKYYYALPKVYSLKEIATQVNNELEARRLKIISYSTVKRYIANQELKNIADPLRYGRQFSKDKIEPYIIRKKPLNSGDVLEIDATVLNFLLRDQNNEIYKLWLCAVIDVSSGKILGYSFDTSENKEMTLKCLKRSFQKLKIIPKMLVHDRHQSYLSILFKNAISKMSDFGIMARQCKQRNPRDKGHIERWFYTFKSGYLKYETGYIGDGIQSGREGGRVNKDLEKLYSKPPFIKNEDEIKRIVLKNIKKYNSTIGSSKKNPNTIFKLRNSKECLKFKKGDLSYIFLKEKITTVRNSKITIKQNNKVHSYPINNTYLVNRINRTSVIIRYDEFDLSKIDVFSNPKDQYEATLYLDQGINIVMSEDDTLKLKAHLKSKKERIHQNLDSIRSDMENGWEELRSIPITSIKKDYDIKEIIAHEENDSLLSNTYPFNKHKNQKKLQKINSDFLKIRSNKKNKYNEIN